MVTGPNNDAHTATSFSQVSAGVGALALRPTVRPRGRRVSSLAPLWRLTFSSAFLSPYFRAKKVGLHLILRKERTACLSGIVHSQRVRIDHEDLRQHLREPRAGLSAPKRADLAPRWPFVGHSITRGDRRRSAKTLRMDVKYADSGALGWRLVVEGEGKVPAGWGYLLGVRKRLSKGRRRDFPTEWITASLASNLGVSETPRSAIPRRQHTTG